MGERMDCIAVDLENCYGIRKLTHTFDASKGATFLVYAPNGMMKSCFARVFDDVARGQSPRDAIFTHRKALWSITNGAGSDIAPEQIFVVKPFDRGYNSDKTAALMVSEDLRRQYESQVESVQERANAAVSALAGSSGLRQGAESILKELFPNSDEDLFTCLKALHDSITKTEDPGLAYVPYAEVFNDKVDKFLAKPATRQKLGEYVERYNELLEKSTYFRRGVFNHTNAISVNKVLKENGFFNAKHRISLADRDGNCTEVLSADELDAAIETEKHQILSDPELAKRFEAMDKEISRNIELRRFRDYLEEHRDLIPRLLDLDILKKDLWLSYAFQSTQALSEFFSTYVTARHRISELVALAKEQETSWRRVVDIFHERFSVPFTLEVANQDDVILRSEVPALVFHYYDGSETCEIESNELLSVLSTGEQRALYLLNILFEIEVLTIRKLPTVLVLDDIADSFDYKNKYAIIEYLNSIQASKLFIMLILTHNFDFFRTVQSRLDVGRAQNTLMATKSDEGVTLVQAQHLNPFRNWKINLHHDRKMMLAAIPLARNLVEYIRGPEDEDYRFLTSLLHIKPNTNKVTMRELAEVMNKVMGTAATGYDDLVVNAIHDEAKSCTTCQHSIQLENKVVMSVGIRLLAEQFMIATINDSTKTDYIKEHQTRVLYEMFCQACDSNDLRRLMERVILMTPDAIHLNSFMYEPILDMSDGSLRQLYDDLVAVSA